MCGDIGLCLAFSLSISWRAFAIINTELPCSFHQQPVTTCVRAQSCLTLRPHGLQPTSLLCPWNFPGKNTGVGCHFLLQGIFSTQGLNLHLLHWQADSLPTVYHTRIQNLLMDKQVVTDCLDFVFMIKPVNQMKRGENSCHEPATVSGLPADPVKFYQSV